MAAELTDSKIIDVADDFKSSYQHAGITVDQFDYFGFARAIWALATQQAAQGAEPVAEVYRLHYGGRMRNIGVNAVRQLVPSDKLPPPGTKLYTSPPPTAEVEKARSDFLLRALTKCESLDRVVDMVHDEHGSPLSMDKARAAIDAALQSDQAQAGKGDGNDE